MSFEAQLAEELGPEPDYSKMTEERIKLEKGQRLIIETNFRLSKSPVAFQQYQDLMERFFWDEGSLEEYRNGLRYVLADQPELRAKFAAFLEAPIESPAQQEEAKARLCEIMGIPGQSRRGKKYPTNAEMKFFETVKVSIRIQMPFRENLEMMLTNYFQKRLGHVDVLEEYLDMEFPMRWKTPWTRESKDEFFAKLAEAIKDEPELLERLEIVWHGWGFENME